MKKSLIGTVVYFLVGVLCMGTFLCLMLKDRGILFSSRESEMESSTAAEETNDLSSETITGDEAAINETMTAEVLREEISELSQSESTDAAVLKDKLLLLKRTEMLTEEEYDLLAKVSAELDGQTALNAVWIEKYSLYPTKENARKLGELVFEESADEVTEGIWNIIPSMEELASLDKVLLIEEVAQWIDQEQWNTIFRMGDGAIEKHTKVVSENGSIVLNTKGTMVEGTCQTADGRVLYIYRVQNELKLLLAEKMTDSIGADYTGADSTGAAESEENLLLEGAFIACNAVLADTVDVTAWMQGNLWNGVTVGDVTLGWNGSEYYGHMTEQGITEVEQQNDCDGVIFAYTKDGQTYLFQQNTTVDEFRLTSEWLGIPIHLERN